MQELHSSCIIELSAVTGLEEKTIESLIKHFEHIRMLEIRKDKDDTVLVSATERLYDLNCTG